jgi:hypothetical protein
MMQVGSVYASAGVDISWLDIIGFLVLAVPASIYASWWYFEAPAGFRGKGWWPFGKGGK